ncbi:hypothetical protein JQ596_00370 [Bradyrhizobium manausense]|uniref:hypothetical protein n=1 Tax=Bradyrhizobium TaxID=374 RepID=UPI001BAB8735|nr:MULTISPECIES: hypothetical protein [Bradyrhizobium]MBR0823967.1 hypothetical protein [Bradyrhizobium manausense]UVO26382.1 hypothetical protein KUF59_27975 [Bradyrhizobium arachidis]
MRTLVLIVCLTAAFGCGGATAEPDQGNANSATVGTARTPPEDKGQLQPQGWTGPLNTQSGGAPAESPQGQSPPGMQAAPEGSDKTVVAPEK